MGIDRALGNAFSGLSAASRAAEIVSRNIANASTPGYAARAPQVSHRIAGGDSLGVRIDRIDRAGDAMLTAERRRLDGDAGRAGMAAEAERAIADLLRDPGGGDSLASRYEAMENALRALADTPESPSVQHSAAAAARAVAVKIAAISTQATQMRAGIDAEIARQIDQVNDATARIQRLNAEIASTIALGRDATGLMDERDRQIEIVNRIIPINATPRSDGAVMLTTRGGGAVLVDHSAQPLSLHPDGADRGVRLGAALARPPDSPGYLNGGALEAAFTTRNVTLGGFLADMDLIAEDLILRFQAAPADPSDPAAYHAGLFVDMTGAPPSGAPYVTATDPPPQRAGLALRIGLNAAIDPAAGGDPGRLRHGVVPAAAVPPGREAVVPGTAIAPPLGLIAAMQALRAPPAIGLAGARDAATLIADYAALRDTKAVGRETESAHLQGAAAAMREQELTASAVDTDAELRNLLAVERAYAANAKVLQIVDQMVRKLLEI